MGPEPLFPAATFTRLVSSAFNMGVECPGPRVPALGSPCVTWDVTLRLGARFPICTMETHPDAPRLVRSKGPAPQVPGPWF